MLTTDQKGSIAETAVVHAAVKLGIEVYKPITDGGRCDLIFELGPRLVRVQCKWAARNGEVIVVRCYSCRRSASGMIHRPYTADEVDAIAAYCAGTDACYFLPLARFGSRPNVQLRIAPARNNQHAGVNWAADYDFECLDWQAIALGP